MKKGIIGFLFIFCIMFAAAVMPANAASGTCGNNLRWTLDDSGILTISGTGNMTDWIDRSSVPWYNVRSSVKTVVIGNGVTRIGDYAFYGCSSLTDITIPDSVTSIGDRAFYNCSSLTDITIPDSVTRIGYEAFSGCSSLTGITIPDSVTSIGGNAFSGCSALADITIPDSVTSIGGVAFSETAWYNNQPNGVVYAGKVAYKYKGTMPQNTSIALKNDTKGIADAAFFYCRSLTDITIPDSVTSIGSSAFSDTAWYNNQPDGVVYAGKVAYKYKGTMPQNTSIALKNDTKGIAGSAFSGCSSLTDITIPDSVTSIGIYAFEDCSSLQKITLPNINCIDSNTFKNCYMLERIVIPKTVKSINSNAVYGCYSLNEVCYEGTKEEWQQISIASGNDYLSNATVVYNYVESKCNIYYDTNGSNDIIDTVEATIGETVKVSGIVPQKEHYRFIGWATDKLSQVPEYFPEDEFEAEKSITLYAIWEPVPYITATYNSYESYKLFFASFNNVPENSVIYFAAYKDGKLVSVENRLYFSNTEVFASFEQANEYKIFVWNYDMTPVCEAYDIEPAEGSII